MSCFVSPPGVGPRVTGEGDLEADILRKGQFIAVKGNQAGAMPKCSVHLHHAEWNTGDIDGSDVKDLHRLQKTLVEGAAKDAACIELFFEPYQVHGRRHRVFGLGILRDSNVNPS
jgi:hypothetical protein